MGEREDDTLLSADLEGPLDDGNGGGGGTSDETATRIESLLNIISSWLAVARVRRLRFSTLQYHDCLSQISHSLRQSVEP